MIDKSLKFIKDELNSYLSRKGVSEENQCVLSNLVEIDARAASNHILLTLVNMEPEEYVRSRPLPPGPMHASTGLNLYINVAAHFNDYATALNRLALAVAFFQSFPLYNASNAPALPNIIEKIVLEPISLSFQDLSSLWGILGGQYLPSMVYKVRVLQKSEEVLTSTIPPA